MRILTADEMQRLDRYAIQKIGISAPVLMESAGRSVFAEIRRREGELTGKRALLFCGAGNNGGDGYVVARYLHLAGADVNVFLVGTKPAAKGEALSNLKVLEKIGVAPQLLRTAGDMRRFQKSSHEWSFAVDALFGTGLKRPLSGIFAAAVEELNRLSCPVYAIDIPSGLNADTGEIHGTAVKANATITFACKKRGFYFREGPSVSGETVVADISIDEEWADKIGAARLYEITPHMVASFFPARRWDTHKGTSGHVLIIGGSAEKSGAVILAARASLRAGAGLVTVAVPDSAHAIIKSQLTEVMSEALPDSNGKIGLSAMNRLSELWRGKDAIIAGPGLKSHAGLAPLLRALLHEGEIPFVLDADALNAFGTNLVKEKRYLKNVIVTPHPGEMARLTGLTTKKIQEDRFTVAREFCDRSGATIVLKGAFTIIAHPDGDTYLNPTGNPAMATAGMGDVLSGVTGAYLAQGLVMKNAALAAVYHHGLAGDRAAARVGSRGLLAGDVIEELPRLFK